MSALDIVTETSVRLFVALDLGDHARRAIATLQRRLANALGAEGSIKMVDPANMHLTLAFLGEIAEPAAPPIVDALSINISGLPFTAEFQGVGVFPSRGAPRVIWLGVEKGADQIVEIQREVARRLEGVGVPLERRPFHPHLTLARWRESHSADRDLALSAAPRDVVARVSVDRITLYQSRLSPLGPTYTALTRANLT